MTVKINHSSLPDDNQQSTLFSTQQLSVCFKKGNTVKEITCGPDGGGLLAMSAQKQVSAHYKYMISKCNIKYSHYSEYTETTYALYKYFYVKIKFVR